MVSSIDMKMAQAAMLFSVFMTGCAVDAVTPEEADLEQADVDVASSVQALEEGEQEETRGGLVPGKGPIGQAPIGKGGPLVPDLGAPPIGKGGPIQGPAGPVDKGGPIGQAPIGQAPFPVGQSGIPGGMPFGSPYGGSPFGGGLGGLPYSPYGGGIPGGLGWGAPGLGGLGGFGGGLGGLGGFPGGLGGLGGGLGGFGGGLGGFPGGFPAGAFAPGMFP
ncbi:hypothetical protein WMF18_20530 [Sorangium sp. So ce315]|uniref:hypothetical protein n=1 Tax=Sorangium sp. So ce315 TaxID=3133299 RepID=UPI003F629A96